MITASGVQWGDVPTWVASLLTGGSLLLGFYILLRDRQKEERGLANRLSYWMTPGPVPRNDVAFPEAVMSVGLHNASDRSVLAPMIVARGKSERRLTAEFDKDELRPYRKAKQAFLSGKEPSLESHFNDDGSLKDRRSLDFQRMMGNTFEEPQEIRPDGRLTLELPMRLPTRYYEIELLYSDGANARWCRNVQTGKLKRMRFETRWQLLVKWIHLHRK